MVTIRFFRLLLDLFDRKVDVKAMGNKTLAIDASIWIHQVTNDANAVCRREKECVCEERAIFWQRAGRRRALAPKHTRIRPLT